MFEGVLLKVSADILINVCLEFKLRNLGIETPPYHAFVVHLPLGEKKKKCCCSNGEESPVARTKWQYAYSY